MAFLITGWKFFARFVRNGHQAPPPTLQIMSTPMEGFNIVPWDWTKFKNNLGENPRGSCVQYIDEAVNNQGFKSKRRVVQKALGYLEAIKGCVKEEWCQDNQDE